MMKFGPNTLKKYKCLKALFEYPAEYLRKYFVFQTISLRWTDCIGLSPQVSMYFLMFVIILAVCMFAPTYRMNALWIELSAKIHLKNVYRPYVLLDSIYILDTCGSHHKVWLNKMLKKCIEWAKLFYSMYFLVNNWKCIEVLQDLII